MTVLGLGLMSSGDYHHSIKKAKDDVQPFQDRTLFTIDDDNHRPHATVIFVNTDEDKVDEFITKARQLAEVTDPIRVATTHKILAKDGMREEQLQKTEPLQRLQDMAIRYLVAPFVKVRGLLSDGTKIIWPEENPTGKKLDETISNLPKDDPECEQYKAIGYDEASGDANLLQKMVKGESRTEEQLQQALKSQEDNPFSRFRPHITQFRLKPESITDKDMLALNAPADGRTIEFDYLVVSKRGPHGTFSKPIAAFNLHKNPIDKPFPHEKKAEHMEGSQVASALDMEKKPLLAS